MSTRLKASKTAANWPTKPSQPSVPTIATSPTGAIPDRHTTTPSARMSMTLLLVATLLIPTKVQVDGNPCPIRLKVWTRARTTASRSTTQARPGTLGVHTPRCPSLCWTTRTCRRMHSTIPMQHSAMWLFPTRRLTISTIRPISWLIMPMPCCASSSASATTVSMAMEKAILTRQGIGLHLLHSPSRT